MVLYRPLATQHNRGELRWLRRPVFRLRTFAAIRYIIGCCASSCSLQLLRSEMTEMSFESRVMTVVHDGAVELEAARVCVAVLVE